MKKQPVEMITNITLLLIIFVVILGLALNWGNELLGMLVRLVVRR